MQITIILAEANEVLTYTLKGQNSGAGNANSIVITDTLPSTVTYVPNSLKVISCTRALLREFKQMHQEMILLNI